jgi:two-component system response regulator RegA
MTPSILVVDDDERLRERLARALRRRGFACRTAADGPEALAAVSADPPDRIILDLRMPGASGLEVLRALRALHPEVAVVMVTGYGSIATAVDAMGLGAVNYVPKPADADEILAAFEGPGSTAVEATPSLARAEWEHINRVLSDCDGNISEAARRLGLHRRSLQRKLQKYPPST